MFEMGHNPTSARWSRRPNFIDSIGGAALVGASP
jgi:hypothetical protein